MPSSSTFSVIGTDVVIKGDVTASADLHVDGRIEGDLSCASLVQGEGSHIEGGITAESARLAGSVTGSITARELVVLKSARIHGDVHYDALTIEQGAEVEGRFAHRVPQQRTTDVPATAAKSESEPKLTLAG
jgi:cytoskeletal protein CcmA (bactofilin family)